MNDSEILKILKDSIYNIEEHKRVLSEPKGEKFLMINISVRNDFNIDIVKDWLKR